MDGVMCLANEWIISLMLYGGTSVFIMYQLFAIGCWVLSFNARFLQIFGSNFFKVMAVVFHFCGLIHLSHVWAKIEPYWYSVSLLYVVLVPAMFYLLILVLRSIGKVKTLRTTQEMEDDRKELSEILLESIVKNAHESKIALEKAKKKLIEKGFTETANQISSLLREIK